MGRERRIAFQILRGAKEVGGKGVKERGRGEARARERYYRGSVHSDCGKEGIEE